MAPGNIILKFLLVLLSTSLFIFQQHTLVEGSSTGLKQNYYATSCPNAEKIIRRTLMMLLMEDPTAGAALLRLAFHDCDVLGCDASIMLDSTRHFRSELESPKNFGIRRLDFIDRMKTVLEMNCPRTVSCADIIALAARDSIYLAGGPNIPILTGRHDSTTASYTIADSKLATSISSIENILSDFCSMGINTEESVALLGAHTLGIGHCISVMNRLYPTVDSSLDILYSVALRVLCPSPTFYLNVTAIPNDPTMFQFDNTYFKEAAQRRTLFALDAAIQTDPRTKEFASRFASDQRIFFDTFSRAFLKLTSHVLPSRSIHVRTHCRRINV